ncbi:AAA family ATPase [uncultured Novosphingobium sp.]|uniref:AAA family ATPase n=1 Tax=uncultured Novosphingobium sp. TaxID=292277 RepID=UPI00259AB2E6|nr:AAA family ATPase [uncultured Novosphingobium sp.]
MSDCVSLEEAKARLTYIGKTAGDVARELGVSNAIVRGVLDGRFKGTRGDAHTAERFEGNDPNVWLATMSPSTAGVSTMLIEIAAAVGLGEVKGSPQQLARLITTRVKGKKGLLIVDEAQELNDKALNELRGIHDRTGLGIVIMGNEVTVGQMAGKKSGLAQISSRVSMRHVQAEPLPSDIDALLDAWGIMAPDQRSFLGKVGATPGALREVTHTIKVANMAAFGLGKQLTLTHLRDAARHRNVRIGNL